MRYIKVFLLILVFFLVMMFFVQNQAAFSDPVVLKIESFFTEPIISPPTPIYGIMLMCFAAGALIVLLMLMWDRIALSSRASSNRRKAQHLERRLQNAQELLTDLEKKTKDAEDKLKAEFAKSQSLLQDEFAKKEAALKAELDDAQHKLEQAGFAG